MSATRVVPGLTVIGLGDRLSVSLKLAVSMVPLVVIVNVLGVVPAARDHWMSSPAPVGSGSVSVTPVAEAVAAAGLLRVTVKSAVCPAVTVGVLVVLVKVRAGASTVTVAEAGGTLVLVELTVTTLGSVPVYDGDGASAALVRPLMSATRVV